MFEVRVARVDELDNVRNFYHGLIDDSLGRNFGPNWQKDIYPSPELLQHSIKNGGIFIGEDNGKFSSCMILNFNYEDKKIAVIHALGVSQYVFNYGFERQMAKFAINLAVKNNQRALWLDSRNYYIHTAGIYERLGFKKINKNFYEYPLPSEIAIRLITNEEMSDIQKMVDESFEVNQPYFPQVFSYDDRETILELSLNYYSKHKDKKIYVLTTEDEIIGCVVVTIYKDNNAYVDLLCIEAKKQKQNFGYAAWIAIEKYFPQVKTWTLETPICLIKNACFYVNKCGFSIIEIKDYKHDFRRFVFRKEMCKN